MSEPVLTFLGVKLSIVQGAMAGSAIAFVLGKEPLLQRLLYAACGAVFAVYGTEGALELISRFVTITDATQRLGGLVFGIVGIVIAQSLIGAAHRLRDRSDDLVDKAIDTKARRSRRAKPSDDDDAPKSE